MFASKTIPLRYRPPHIIAMLYHVEIINLQLVTLNNTIIITITI